MIRFAIPELSIVLPTRDAEDCIVNALQQVGTYLTERNVHAEVIVVDDASQDRTAQRAEQMAAEFVDLRVLRCDRRGGIGRAVRLGMLIASGRDRVYLDPNHSELLGELTALRAAADLAAVAPDVVVSGPITMLCAAAADEVFPRCRLDGRGFDIEVLAVSRALGFSVLTFGAEPEQSLSIFDRARVRSRLRDLRQHADARDRLRVGGPAL